jgi:hypothetical protein
MAVNNSEISTETCRQWMIDGVVPEADTEISGIGVIMAFLLSAYITFAIVFVAYLLGSINTSLLRPVDLYVHKLPSQRRTSQSWHLALESCVLLLSDQQIVTGIAICIAGFIGLHGKISVYYFQIVIMLAWMSSSVHLSALTMLGENFHKRRAVLWWRLVGMMTLFVLLLVALVPTGSNLWAIWWTGDSDDQYRTTSWAIPAKCFFFKTWGEGVNPDAPLAYLILVLSYIWKVGALFNGSRNMFHRRFRGPCDYLLEGILHREALRATKRRGRRELSWKYYATMVVYVILLALFEFAASFAASLWLSLIGLLYGTIQIVVPRRQNAWWNKKEDTWTFGQVIPLVLLIQPIGAVLESLYPHGSERESRSNHESRSSSDEAYELHSTVNTGMLLHQDESSRLTPTISDMFACIEVPKPSQRSTKPVEHQIPFYSSNLFKILIVLVHAAIAGISGIVFYNDALSIGYNTSQNYYFVLIGLGAALGALVLSCVVMIPFSRVYR